MARSRRQRKFSGTQFADPFILPKGRSVIKGFDADDGDFIGVPSDAKFKLLKRKGGVLIKGKGFRSMAKGADVKTLQGAVRISDAEQEAEWRKYFDGTVDIKIYDDSRGRYLYLYDYGQVNAPSSMYEDWDYIYIEPDVGELSFLNDEIVLGKGDTHVTLSYDYSSYGGDLNLPKIDGGRGDDTLELLYFPEVSRPIMPQDFENLDLSFNYDSAWSIEGKHPQMSVNIYDGGIQLSEDTVLKNVWAIWWSDTHNKANSKTPFVSASPGDTIDFNKAFTDKEEKLVIYPYWSSSETRVKKGDFVLLSGNYKNADIDNLLSKDHLVGTPQIDEEENKVFVEYEQGNNDITMTFHEPKSSGEDILVELTAIPVVPI